MATRYNVEGTVYNEDGTPAGNRAVHIYDRATGDKVQTLVTDVGTGKFRTNYYNTRELFVVAMPNPQDGSNAKVFDKVVPVVAEIETNVNNIGLMGQKGFGLGIAPVVPNSLQALPGTTDINSDQYGNYRVIVDGSIMVWVPAFWYKWGNGSNGLAMNEPSIVQFNTYPDHATANAAGYVLHRAFIDGGSIKEGFFIDKYQNSKHQTLDMPTSQTGRVPMTANSAAGSTNVNAVDPNQSYPVAFPQFDGSIGSYINAAKLRGTGFSIPSSFIYNAMSMLAYAHGWASPNTSNNAWYMPSPGNHPKGMNINSGGANNQCFEDVAHRGAIPTPSWQVCVISTFVNNAKASHNGQLCGVWDLYSNATEIGIGWLYTSNTHYILKESIKLSDIRYNASVAEHVGAVANYDSLGTTISDYTSVSGATVSGTKTKQMWNMTTDRTSLDYKYLSLGFFISGNIVATAPNDLGNSQWKSFTSNAIGRYGAGSDWQNRGSLFSWSKSQAMTTVNVSTGMRCCLYV